MVLPAYLIIILVTGILKNAIKNPHVQAVLSGLSPCVVGIVTATGLWMTLRGCLSPGAGSVVNLLITLLLAAALILYPRITEKKLSPIRLILLSAVLGMLLY